MSYHSMAVALYIHIDCIDCINMLSTPFVWKKVKWSHKTTHDVVLDVQRLTCSVGNTDGCADCSMVGSLEAEGLSVNIADGKIDFDGNEVGESFGEFEGPAVGDSVDCFDG